MKFFSRIPTAAWLAVFVMIALLQVWLVRDAVMGDAFIHFVFARGIATGEPFFYNGIFSAGSTSPAWSLLLAPIWYFFSDGVIVGVKVLASVFAASSVVLTFFLAREILKNRTLALVASALVAGSYVLSFWAAKGMETPLAVSLVLGSFLVYLQLLKNKSVVKEITLGLLLGATILTRPEGWFLATFLGVPLLFRIGWRVIFTIGLPAAAIFGPYYFYLFEMTGQIFPSSAARILRARQWAHEAFGIFWTPEIGKILLTKFLFLTPFAVLFFFRKKEKNWWVWGPLVAWLTFFAIFFTFVFPTTEGYRYLLPAIPFFIILALAGVATCRDKKWRARILFVIVLGSFGISGIQLAERMQSITSCEQPWIDHVRRETGIWLQEHTPENAVVAIKEVDQSAYFSGRQVLSIDGTLDSAAIPFVENHDQLGFLNEYRPDYFVMEEEMYLEYPDWQDSNVTPLVNVNKVGDKKSLDNIEFELVEIKPVGDENSCRHFTDAREWRIFELNYSQ